MPPLLREIYYPHPNLQWLDSFSHFMETFRKYFSYFSSMIISNHTAPNMKEKKADTWNNQNSLVLLFFPKYDNVLVTEYFLKDTCLKANTLLSYH